jgi:hypothetical protein
MFNRPVHRLKLEGAARRLRPAFNSLAACLCLFATLAAHAAVVDTPQPSAVGGISAAAPLRVYVTWLNQERTTGVLVFRGRGEQRRVVAGVAKPFLETSPDEPGHLYQIPGFREHVPSADLNAFREGLRVTRSTETAVGKYVFVPRPPESNSNILFDSIDQGFRDYVRTPPERPGDLEVWEVNLSPSPAGIFQWLHVVFAGDLVLVKSKADESARGRTEAALVNLLSALAHDEGLQDNAVKLSGDCGGAKQLAALQTSPVNREERRHIRDSVNGGLSGPPGGDDVYSVVNTGWKKKTLQLKVEPEEGRADVKFMSAGDEIPDAGLELQPCTPLTLSVEPRRWYNDLRGRVTFTRQGETLTARVPALGVQRALVIVSCLPALLLFVVGLRSLLKRRRAANEQGNEKGGKSQAKVYRNAEFAGRGWKRFFTFPRTPEQKSTVAGQDPPPAEEGLPDLLRKRDTAYEEVRRLDGQLEAYIEKTLRDTLSSEEVREELRKVREERDCWANTFKPLGETPAEAFHNWQQVTERKDYLAGQVVEINSRLNGADVAPDENAGGNGQPAEKLTDHVVGLALIKLSESVPALKKEVGEYRDMARRILPALPGASTSDATDGLPAPSRLADEVADLRGFVEQVLRKYAEPLRLGDDAELGALSVASLKERFERCGRRYAALQLLESDERVRRARAVSGELAHVGRVLCDGTRPEYDELLAGSEIKPAALSQELLKAAKSSDAALTVPLSKLAGATEENPHWRGQFDAGEVDEALAHFSKHLLLEEPAAALLHMLRLWQVMVAYCRESPDSLASEFYEQGQEFIRGCEQVVADLARLGLRLHPVRFFKKPGVNHDDPEGRGWDFTDATSISYVQHTPKLFAPIRDMLNSNFKEYEMTVADVTAWGFDCDFAPDLKRPTLLWLWGWDARGSTET